MITHNTRRSFLRSLLTVPAAFWGMATIVTATTPQVIISAGDPGADGLEVYDAHSGEIHSLVRTVAVGCWIEKYATGSMPGATARTILRDENGTPIMRKVNGDFRVRPKPRNATLFNSSLWLRSRTKLQLRGGENI